MNDIESGLLLPIRFYRTVSEQDRFKRHSIGVALTELNYPYVDCSSLAPFQVSLVSQTLYPSDLSLKIYCPDTGLSTILGIDKHFLSEIIDDTYYFWYDGSSAFAGLGNGLYYLQLIITFDDLVAEFYSDLFRIGNCMSADQSIYDNTEYRAYNNEPSSKRAIDITDLRITKE